MRERIGRIAQILGFVSPKRPREVSPTGEEQIRVRNPYANLDRTRHEAFRRIPGVVNVVSCDTEGALRGGFSLTTEEETKKSSETT